MKQDTHPYADVIEKLKKQLSPLLEEKKIEDIKAVKRENEIKGLQIAIENLEKIGAAPETTLKDIQIPEIEISDLLDHNNTAEFIYPANKTWAERIKAYMKYKNIPLKITDLVDAFVPFEPEYTPDKIRAALNNAIQTMYREQQLKVYEPPRKEKGFYYGHPLWFEGDKLKAEHIPPQRKKTMW